MKCFPARGTAESTLQAVIDGRNMDQLEGDGLYYLDVNRSAVKENPFKPVLASMPKRLLRTARLLSIWMALSWSSANQATAFI